MEELKNTQPEDQNADDQEFTIKDLAEVLREEAHNMQTECKDDQGTAEDEEVYQDAAVYKDEYDSEDSEKRPSKIIGCITAVLIIFLGSVLYTISAFAYHNSQTSKLQLSYGALPFIPDCWGYTYIKYENINREVELSVRSGNDHEVYLLAQALWRQSQSLEDRYNAYYLLSTAKKLFSYCADPLRAKWQKNGMDPVFAASKAGEFVNPYPTQQWLEEGLGLKLPKSKKAL